MAIFAWITANLLALFVGALVGWNLHVAYGG